MIKTIRAQSPILLTILFILISASFLVFYNIPQFEQLRDHGLGKINGREVSKDEFTMARQAAEQSAMLTGQREATGEMVDNLAWGRMILLAEAKKLGLTATDQETIDYIFKLPVFQKEGKFNGEGYDLFQKSLGSRGMTTDRFEQIMKEDVILDKVQEAILAPVQVSGSEINKTMDDYFGPVKVGVIRWQKEDFLSQVKVEPSEIENEYHTHASNPDYRTLEHRRVAFVSFLLTPEQMKLPEAAKAAAKRALGEKATDFAVDVVDKVATQPEVWDQSAKEAGVTSVTTSLFAKNETPKELPMISPSFNNAVFQLNKENPVSDAVETDSGYLVIHLLEIQPSELLPLDQIRPVVEQHLREQGATDLLNKKANEIAATLKVGSLLAKGKSFSDLAKGLKLNVEMDGPFSAFNLPPTLKDGQAIMQAVRTLAVGQSTPFIPTETGGLLVHLESRSPVDVATADKMKPRVQYELLQERRQAMMEEWMQTYMQRPDVAMPQFLKERASS